MAILGSSCIFATSNLNLIIMVQVTVSNVKRGSFLRLRNSEDSPLWIRGDYDRSSRTYSLISYDDSCHELFRKGSCKVYIEDYEA